VQGILGRKQGERVLEEAAGGRRRRLGRLLAAAAARGEQRNEGERAGGDRQGVRAAQAGDEKRLAAHPR
jgi:hypothetical protein